MFNSIGYYEVEGKPETDLQRADYEIPFPSHSRLKGGSTFIKNSRQLPVHIDATFTQGPKMHAD